MMTERKRVKNLQGERERENEKAEKKKHGERESDRKKRENDRETEVAIFGRQRILIDLISLGNWETVSGVLGRREGDVSGKVAFIIIRKFWKSCVVL